jgi:ribosomal protein S4
LYNLSRLQTPLANKQTFFQQKWMAKSLTRAYHGEQIREGKWTGMFDRRLPAVVPMDYKVLARTDGSDQAAGRGSGLTKPNTTDEDWEERPRPPPKTPYMHMTYFPTERRLDTAVWRALFASSARQARQYVVHVFVKVNGKKVCPFLPLLLHIF